MEEGKIFTVEYHVKIGAGWKTKRVEIKSTIDGQVKLHTFKKGKNENWLYNGQVLPPFTGYTEVDLPLTPLTNTLPINRLRLPIGQQQLIKVIDVDLLNDSITPVTQKYTRLSKFEYKYENVPNDFEAIIRVDESGFVIDYPGLFERIARKDTSP